MPDPYHLRDFTTLDIKENDSDTVMGVAGITDVTIVPSVTIDRLMTADSIKAETRKQYDFGVQVDIGYAKFSENVDLVQQWMAGSGGSTSTSMTDTSDPQTFDIDGVFDSVGGDRTLSVTVADITFEEMPVFDGSQDEFVAWDLSGEGEDLTDVSITDNTA